MLFSFFNIGLRVKNLFNSSILLFAIITFSLSFGTAHAEDFEGYCGTATNQAHVSAGRAVKVNYVYAEAVGSGEDLGMYFSDSATLRETSEGYYTVVAECPPKPVKPYEHAEEATDNLIFDDIGPLKIATAGGHLLTSSTGNYPHEDEVSTNGTINIPENAVIRHVLLYYSGSAALEGGDFTADQLESIADIQNNRITFSINGDSYDPMSPGLNAPDPTSSIGSTTHYREPSTFTWGTLTGVTITYWTNRLDITELFKSTYRGDVNISVNPPENLDVSANTSQLNGGNPAGSSVYNPCFGTANWSLMVIYEEPGETNRQLIVRDGMSLAWDYTYIHKGIWRRPKFSFDHQPVAGDIEFFAYGTGARGGSAIPSNPTCACGCGGLYNLAPGSGYDATSSFFSNQHEDPVAVWNDPMHRDKNNGPWSLVSDGSTSVVGNDWTLVDSGGIYTEFPNLFEGENVAADEIQPVTNENEMTVAGDIYGGHPWEGRGEVTYYGWGNTISILGVKLDPSAVTQGETTTTIYMKGDQKDVFKPQASILLSYLALSVDVDGGDQTPEITLNGSNPVNLLAGTTYTEPGFSAFDNEDGDITANVAVSCNFNTAQPVSAGSYECSYSVTDSADNTTTVTRTVIAAENQAPVITILGDNPLVLTDGSAYSEAGATANDPEEGDISASIETSCDFDTATALSSGTYSCTYTVADTQGLTDSESRTITVTANQAPVITLLGNNPVTITQGSVYNDPGATAADPEDGDISASITTSCDLDANTVGTYTCSYSVSDSQGLAAPTVTRTVIVEQLPACNDYTATLSQHESAGRAYSQTETTGQTCWGSWCWGGTTTTTWYATGSGETLGTSGSTSVTLKEQPVGSNNFTVGSCPTDPQPPVIESYQITSLTYDQAVVTGTASDPDGDISVVTLGLGAVDGIACEGTTSFTCTLDYSVYEIAVGEAFGVSLYATDSLGATSNIESFTITRPEQQASVPPVISNLNYSVVGQGISVTATVADVDDDLVEVKVIVTSEIGAFGCENTSGDNYSCVAATVTPRSYTMKLVAVDAANNVTESEEFTVTVEEAGACYTATNSEHTAAGRAYQMYNVIYYAQGSDAYLGLSSTSTSLEETSSGVWTLVDSCQ